MTILCSFTKHLEIRKFEMLHMLTKFSLWGYLAVIYKTTALHA